MEDWVVWAWSHWVTIAFYLRWLVVVACKHDVALTLWIYWAVPRGHAVYVWGNKTVVLVLLSELNFLVQCFTEKLTIDYITEWVWLTAYLCLVVENLWLWLRLWVVFSSGALPLTLGFTWDCELCLVVEHHLWSAALPETVSCVQ